MSFTSPFTSFTVGFNCSRKSKSQEGEKDKVEEDEEKEEEDEEEEKEEEELKGKKKDGTVIRIPLLLWLVTAELGQQSTTHIYHSE